MSITTIKNLIPFIFALIIIGFIVKLGADNRQLRISNASLTAESKQLNVKNKLVDKEAKRRAAAEMKSQRLQEEVKDALKNNKCSIELIPNSVVDQLRRQADSIRSGKDANSTDNWGMGNVDKWIANGSDISQLPKETREYTAKVYGNMGNARNYYATQGRMADNRPYQLASSGGQPQIQNSTHINTVNVNSNPTTVDALTKSINQQASRASTNAAFSSGVR